MRVQLLLALLSLAAFQAMAVDPPPYTPDRVTAGRFAPAAQSTEIVTAAVSTLAPVFADLNSGQFGNNSVTQNVSFTNDPANTSRICIKAVQIPFPVVLATDTCAEVCATAAVTCNKSSTDGEWLDPGQTLPKCDTGLFCYCAVATTGSPIMQSKRIAR